MLKAIAKITLGFVAVIFIMMASVVLFVNLLFYAF